MNGFLCIVRHDQRPVTPEHRAPFETRWGRLIGTRPRWQSSTFTAITTAAGLSSNAPGLMVTDRYVAVGSVRLDNRESIVGCLQFTDSRLSDLALAAAFVQANGRSAARDLIGDFAFVVADLEQRGVYAVRDAFGVRRLYVRQWPRVTAFASHASLLGEDGNYDAEFARAFLIDSMDGSGRTIFRDVSTVPSGTVTTLEGGTLRANRYWSAYEFQRASLLPIPETLERFRGLFAEAVMTRLASADPVWAQLSGGLDSSAVVSTASWLNGSGRSQRLAGTVTLVDKLGNADERTYSDAVVTEYGVRNEIVSVAAPWQDDGEPPAFTDEPMGTYPYYARDRAMVRIVRSAGSSVLLSGHASDFYLCGSNLTVADLIVRGRVLAAARRAARWAAGERQSFWRALHGSGIRPIARSLFARPFRYIPAWVRAEANRWARPRTPPSRLAPPHGYFSQPILDGVATVDCWHDRGVLADALDIRYPFLHRPFVELALTVPPDFIFQPRARKWILRESLRGILPERVRTRRGKGGIGARIRWSFVEERRLLRWLAKDSILGQMGCVDERVLRDHLRQARRGHSRLASYLFGTLALETWLRVRSGQWDQAAALVQTHSADIDSPNSHSSEAHT
jgi:asparagine synthase (glutamine-hydrolysing)